MAAEEFVYAPFRQTPKIAKWIQKAIRNLWLRTMESSHIVVKVLRKTLMMTSLLAFGYKQSCLVHVITHGKKLMHLLLQLLTSLSSGIRMHLMTMSSYLSSTFEIQLLKKMVEELVEESNKYCVQSNPNKSLVLGQAELEQFIGILFTIRTVKLPKAQMYWSTDTHYDKIAKTLSHECRNEPECRRNENSDGIRWHSKCILNILTEFCVHSEYLGTWWVVTSQSVLHMFKTFTVHSKWNGIRSVF